MAQWLAMTVLLLAVIAADAQCPDWQAALNLHNVLRAKHSAPALTWNATMANMASSWSAGLAPSASCSLTHSSSSQRDNNGENLYALWGRSTPNCTAAVQSWYNEISSYQFTSTPWTTNQANFANIGHFTQVVWKGSLQLGCGAAVSSSGCYVVTCRYSPAGNYVGDANFLANVLPASNTASPPPKPPSPSPKPAPPSPPRSAAPPLKAPSPPLRSPPPSPSQAACVDKFSYCAWAASNNYCDPKWYWQDGSGRVVDTCALSCNNCPAAGRRMQAGEAKGVPATTAGAEGSDVAERWVVTPPASL